MGDVPWQYIMMDFFTDLPIATEPYTILVMVDRFSKLLVLINLGTKIDAEFIAGVFFEYIVDIYELPCIINNIISNWYPHFAA